MPTEKTKLVDAAEKLAERAEDCFERAQDQHDIADAQHASAEKLTVLGTALEADATKLLGEAKMPSDPMPLLLLKESDVRPTPSHSAR